MSIHISNKLLSNRNLIIICSVAVLAGFVFVNFLILYFPKDSRIDLNGLTNISIQSITNETKNQVATTDLGIYDIAKAIAKEGVLIIYVSPTKKLNEDFEDNNKAFEPIYISRAFITTGQDNWIDQKKDQLTNTEILDLSKAINLKPVLPAIDLGFGNTKDEQFNDQQQNLDYNYLLDESNLKIAIESIAQLLIKIDPSNKDLYFKNQIELTTQITNIETQYSTILSCNKIPIITNANNLNYLAQKYNLDLTSFANLDLTSLDQNQLKYIQDFTKSKNITSFLIDKKIPLIDYNNLKKNLGVEIYFISDYIYADVIDTLSKNLENLKKTQNCE
jgi:ABC-type Zn uptake system ZnuABC Zn-binding protein ZnuA